MSNTPEGWEAAYHEWRDVAVFPDDLDCFRAGYEAASRRPSVEDYGALIPKFRELIASGFTYNATPNAIACVLVNEVIALFTPTHEEEKT